MTGIICNHCINNANSIFFSLGQEEKNILSQKHKCLNFNKNQIIYREGEKPDGLICLSAGKVKIYKEGIGGREQIVRMARPVGFIGYRALFAEENYMATSVALEDSTICIINRDSLFRVLGTNSELSLKIIRSFATELGFSNSRTVTLTQKHIRGRLAESLIFLKDTYGLEN
jgi:CRP/FNR family transcriptional regulator, polysaccharide utilization system transcription regulator